MASPSPVLFVALVSALFMGSLASPTSRMLGGSDANPGEFAYMASVRRDSVHVCGGSIIGEKFILTAAHCVSDIGTKPVNPSAITVRVGSQNQYAGGKLMEVENILIHYNYGSFLYDVAVLELTDPVVLGPKVKIIELADSADFVLAESTVAIAGWGRTEIGGKNSYKLQQGDATVITAAECNDSIGYGYTHTLCVKSKSGSGSCNGDAGGPAVFNNKLVGISNFVIGACGTRYPDVYARVSFFYDWIKSITNPK